MVRLGYVRFYRFTSCQLSNFESKGRGFEFRQGSKGRTFSEQAVQLEMHFSDQCDQIWLFVIDAIYFLLQIITSRFQNISKTCQRVQEISSAKYKGKSYIVDYCKSGPYKHSNIFPFLPSYFSLLISGTDLFIFSLRNKNPLRKPLVFI